VDENIAKLGPDIASSNNAAENIFKNMLAVRRCSHLGMILRRILKQLSSVLWRKICIAIAIK